MNTWLKQWYWRRKLARMVEQQRERNANYLKRRQSALKGWNTRRAG